MMARATFLFDFGSPNAYLAHRAVPAIERRTGVRFAYQPVLLGGVFKLTGNRSPYESLKDIRNKLAYEHLEIARFLRHHGIEDFTFNPHFPVNTLTLMRGAVAADEAGVFERYVEAMFQGLWVEGLALGHRAELVRALNRADLDGARLLAAAGEERVKERLRRQTEQAVTRGVFGVPTFFVDDEIFFGKDRLDQVEEAILAARGMAATRAGTGMVPGTGVEPA